MRISPQLTIATATVFCHRFYALNSHTRTENDWHVLAPACLFLAGKVEETPKALRDVVFVAYMMRHRKEPEKAQEALKNKARRDAATHARTSPRVWAPARARARSRGAEGGVCGAQAVSRRA